MHPVVFDQPYEFVPPYRGRIWPRLLQLVLRHRLRKDYGIDEVSCSGLEHLKASISAGHGVLLAPNHCRPADPMVVNEMCRQAGEVPFIMASWHLFMAGRMQRFILRRAGAFSVYREGMDRQALQEATQILANAERPLVVFPEGVVTRTNDRLITLMDGLSFIARSAAKKRAGKDASAPSDAKVVVHPIAIRYHTRGDFTSSLQQTLDEIESRLSWRPQSDLDLPSRIYRVGEALLCLKEMEYLGGPQPGALHERLQKLIDGMLNPLESEWLPGKSTDQMTIVARVKQLRSAILRDMIDGELDEKERARRWRHLEDMYIAQQLGHYPPDYIRSNPTTERIVETVEKFEEDLTDDCRVHGRISATVQIGQAIEVPSGRQRGEDPVMSELNRRLHHLLGISVDPVLTSSSHELSQADPSSTEVAVENASPE